jgi:hypothetical protein
MLCISCFGFLRWTKNTVLEIGTDSHACICKRKSGPPIPGLHGALPRPLAVWRHYHVPLYCTPHHLMGDLPSCSVTHRLPRESTIREASCAVLLFLRADGCTMLAMRPTRDHRKILSAYIGSLMDVKDYCKTGQHLPTGVDHSVKTCLRRLPLAIQ